MLNKLLTQVEKILSFLLAWVSVYRYEIHDSPYEVGLVIPYSPSLGENLHLFHWVKLRTLDHGDRFKVLVLNTPVFQEMTPLFFEKDQVLVYAEPIYNWIIATNSRISFQELILKFLYRKLKRRGYKVYPDVSPGYLDQLEAMYGSARRYINLHFRKNFKLSLTERNAFYLRGFAFRDEWSRLVVQYPYPSPAIALIDQIKHQSLLHSLGVTTPYVCLHIRLDHNYGFRDNMGNNQNVRSVTDVAPYEQVIKRLIHHGYTVVRIGDKKDVKLGFSLEGFIEYPHSGLQSVQHDLSLIAGCSFLVSSASGPELYAYICNKPFIAMNHFCFHSSPQFYKYVRQVPKEVVRQDGTPVSLVQLMKTPELFTLHSYSQLRAYGLELRDSRLSWMLNGIDEMVALVSDPATIWDRYTDLQTKFRQLLTPLHFEYYKSKGVPCDSYLQEIKDEL